MKRYVTILLFLLAFKLSADPRQAIIQLGITAENLTVNTYLNSLKNKSIFFRYAPDQINAVGIQLSLRNSNISNPFADYDNNFNGKYVTELSLNYTRLLNNESRVTPFFSIGPTLVISGKEFFNESVENQPEKIPEDFFFSWGINYAIGIQYKIGRSLYFVMDYHTTFRNQIKYNVHDITSMNVDYGDYVRPIYYDASAKITRSELVSSVRLGFALSF